MRISIENNAVHSPFCSESEVLMVRDVCHEMCSILEENIYVYFIRKLLYDNLTRLEAPMLKGITMERCAYQMLSQIPIYIVDVNSEGKLTEDGHKIPSCISPFLSFETQIEQTDEHTGEKEKVSRKIPIKKRHLMCRYQRDGVVNSIDEIPTKCRIFIWMDLVKKIAHYNDWALKLVLDYVVCNAFSHFIMDDLDVEFFDNSHIDNEYVKSHLFIQGERLAMGFTVVLHLWFRKLYDEELYEFQRFLGFPYSLGSMCAAESVLTSWLSTFRNERRQIVGGRSDELLAKIKSSLNFWGKFDFLCNPISRPLKRDKWFG